jgi:hypothetical protein
MLSREREGNNNDATAAGVARLCVGTTRCWGVVVSPCSGAVALGEGKREKKKESVVKAVG